MKTLRLGIASVVILGLGATGTALATAPSQIRIDEISVSYADLNIHTNEGARVLYARLKKASRRVCGVVSFYEAGSFSQLQEAKACYTDALDTAVADIDSEALSEIHSG